MFSATLFVILATLIGQSEQPTPTLVTPNFHDLKITIRETHGLQTPQITTWYFKGARERVEHTGVSLTATPFNAMITQCDEQHTIHLNLQQGTYQSFPIHLSAQKQRGGYHSGGDGPIVYVDIHSADTGHRRKVGAYEVHEIKTTIKVKPQSGAATPPGEVKADSWYLQLPGLNCRQTDERNLMQMWMGLVERPRAAHGDQVVFRYSGIDPSGFLLEETYTQRSGGNVIQNKTEAVEISTDPLDDSLFEIPSEFTVQAPAHHLPIAPTQPRPPEPEVEKP
jgi:hypothetical protein